MYTWAIFDSSRITGYHAHPANIDVRIQKTWQTTLDIGGDQEMFND